MNSDTEDGPVATPFGLPPIEPVFGQEDYDANADIVRLPFLVQHELHGVPDAMAGAAG